MNGICVPLQSIFPDLFFSLHILSHILCELYNVVVKIEPGPDRYTGRYWEELSDNFPWSYIIHDNTQEYISDCSMQSIRTFPRALRRENNPQIALMQSLMHRITTSLPPITCAPMENGILHDKILIYAMTLNNLWSCLYWIIWWLGG